MFRIFKEVKQLRTDVDYLLKNRIREIEFESQTLELKAILNTSQSLLVAMSQYNEEKMKPRNKKKQLGLEFLSELGSLCGSTPVVINNHA